MRLRLQGLPGAAACITWPGAWHISAVASCCSGPGTTDLIGCRGRHRCQLEAGCRAGLICRDVCGGTVGAGFPRGQGVPQRPVQRRQRGRPDGVRTWVAPLHAAIASGPWGLTRLSDPPGERGDACCAACLRKSSPLVAGGCSRGIASQLHCPCTACARQENRAPVPPSHLRLLILLHQA